MIDSQLPGLWKTSTVSLTLGNTTQAKILCDVTPPFIQPAVSGETAIPGVGGAESGVRQRVMTGGQRVIDGQWTSTDGTARSARLWVASQLSFYANMGTVTISATNAINRSGGSFITDGWQIGDSAMVFGSANAANNGILLQATAVTATVLTFNGTPLANVTEAAGFRVVRVALRYQKPLAITAGSIDGAPPVPLLGGSQDPGSAPLPDTGLSLDQFGMLLASTPASLSALPARVDVHAVSILY